MGIIKIVHLYPKELNLYGDSGNTACICKRLTDRGYLAEVIEVGIGDSIPQFDIMLIGGGQDKEMLAIEQDLKRKSEMLSYSVHNGKTILAICGGYQLLGEYYKSKEGKAIRLSSALDFYTVGEDKRHIGNIVFETQFGKVIGFENHSGVTYLGKELKPLGKVIKGFGNDGKGGEGILYKNTFGTYAHGPVLPKNPAFADELIKRALEIEELKPLDDELENNCHNSLISHFVKWIVYKKFIIWYNKCK